MIYIMLMKCGLGNQMFTYAYACYLQNMNLSYLKNFDEIIINPYLFTFGAPSKTVEERGLSLQHFALSQTTVFLNETEQKENQKQYLGKLKTSTGLYNKVIRKFFYTNRLGELNYRHRFRRGLYNSYRPHSSFKKVLSKEKDKFVFGYFQDAKPFCEIADALKKDFEIITPTSRKNTEWLDKIRKENAVCLHIRRGDYLIPECRHLNICDEDYYQKGIQYIQENTKNPTFFVFSNTHEDLKWIENNYNFNGLPVVYVDAQNPDYEDLRLMKACKHFVISNSSFSWWAAFLSDYEKKIVCMPERWDLEYPGDANMYVSGWIKLPTKKHEEENLDDVSIKLD